MAQFVCDDQLGCSITVKVEPAPADPERVQDLLDLFYLFLAILVTVYGLKKLLSLFDNPHDE